MGSLRWPHLCLMAAAFLQIGCGMSGKSNKQPSAMPIGTPLRIEAPLGLPPEPVPHWSPGAYYVEIYADDVYKTRVDFTVRSDE